MVYRARTRAEPAAWMIVDGVPANVTRPMVQAAIESAAYWPDWQRRIGVGASLKLQAERYWPDWLRDIADAENGIYHESWARLTADSRRLSIPLTARVHGLVRKAAADAGMSAAAWAARTLEAAAINETTKQESEE